MTTPLISIIVPTRNEEKVLHACLHSLISQDTRHPYEVLVIDTNSHDQTLAIAETFGVRIIKEDRPGRSIAKQTGVEHAKGQIICFTEADCVLPNSWLSVILEAFETHPNAAALTGIYTFIDSPPVYNFITTQFFLPLSVYAFRIVFGYYALRATNFAVSAEALHRTGGFNPQAIDWDDVELSARVKEFGDILYLPAMKVKTCARRIRGRFLKYLLEFIKSFYITIIKKRIVTRSVYEDIR